MTTIGGKVCIIVGILVIIGAVTIAENILIKVFGLIAGLIVMIQGIRMKPIIPTTTTNYHKPSNLGPEWDIKKDKSSKGAI